MRPVRLGLFFGIVLLGFVAVSPLFAKSKHTLPLVIQQPQSWVVVKPRQCLENVWEKEWIAQHKKKAAYPITEEKDIIKSYFARRGITVFEIRSNPSMGATCKTCDCERGDTLYLLIGAEDVSKMKDLGFENAIPAPAAKTSS